VSIYLEEARARVGQKARKWTLDHLLDVGGMAAVYGATHKNGNKVAIKVMHRQYAAMPEAKERFLREGYVANKVQHDNAVTVLDDDELDDGTPFLVMELLVGQSLEGRLRERGRLEPVETLYVTHQVLDVLGHGHARGIIHRDIKPPNVFLTTEGKVKVLDFGLARVLEKDDAMSLTRSGTIVGTASYMSPEQARGKRMQIDHRTDLYATGAVMFRCLAGRGMFLHDNPMDRLLAVMSEPAPSLGSVAADVPADLVTLVDRAVAFQKEQRFPDAASMQAAVRAIYERLAGPMPTGQVEAATWTLPPRAPQPLTPMEDIHVSVVFSDPGVGDSIVVDLEDLDSGERTRRELRRDEGDSLSIIVDTDEVG
jgi:eukaryotic-like serine/threonine-protein kinase